MIQTHGNLTVLVLTGLVLRSKYSLEMPLDGTKKRLLSNLLIPRFEVPDDFPEYFSKFDRSVRILLDGLDAWVKRASKRQRRQEGLIDIRKLFISPVTHQLILRDARMRQHLRRAQKRIPDLSA